MGLFLNKQLNNLKLLKVPFKFLCAFLKNAMFLKLFI